MRVAVAIITATTAHSHVGGGSAALPISSPTVPHSYRAKRRTETEIPSQCTQCLQHPVVRAYARYSASVYCPQLTISKSNDAPCVPRNAVYAWRKLRKESPAEGQEQGPLAATTLPALA